MKILFLTDNFPPEVNAPATRTFEHCREWVGAGATVTVITCAPNFPSGRVFDGYANRFYQREVVEGIEVIRVWTYIAPNAGFLRRVVDYLSFALASFLAGVRIDFDVVVATSPQFFTTFSAAALSVCRQRPWVFELRDLWPESIIATGAMEPGFTIRALERCELALYRSATSVVALTDAFRENLVARGIEREKICVIPNGVPADWPRTEETSGPRKREAVCVVGYVGTIGMAHGLELVLQVAEILSEEGFEFLLVGDGAMRASLVAQASERGLSNVRFLPPVERHRLPEILASVDIALVPLRNEMAFRSVIPSKIFEAAAARRPVVLGVEGEARRLVERYGAGLAFEPDNPRDLAETLRRLTHDVELYRRLQEGCDRLAAAYDRRELAAQMLAHLRDLVRTGSYFDVGTSG
jgi:hypothetical protein